MRRWKKSKKMSKAFLKWDNYKRSMSVIKKSMENTDVNAMFEKYRGIIYGVCKDVEVVTETYMRLTTEYNENQEFMQQFMAVYKKLRRIKMIDMQKAASTWIPILENQIDNGVDKQTEE